ncbi:protein translocase subunit SecF [Pelagibius sp.]|uniref:protein translocase subunit SecF n=1 Tax=Pelagibius sp. TaxID=1931238 RepID=UPI003B514F3D
MALIRKLPLDLGLNFVGKRGMFLVMSACLMLGSIGLFFTQGLNFGVDFRGGILMEVRTDGPANLADLRSRVSGLGLGEVTLQEFGEPTDVLINIERQEGAQEEQIRAIEVVREALGEGVEIRRQEFVGPKVGDELKQAGLLATLLALAGIGLYIWFRFEWHFSVAALVALAHDVIATIGFFALTQLEFNLATLAAVLTIAGYSINDTVVIFDRVRETLRRYKKLPLVEVLNRALNLTLSRTILTSMTTLLALGALFFFGGAVIQGFTAGLIWGVVIGTYSSVALAVPLLSYMKLRRGGEEDEAEAKGGAAQTS